MISRTIFGFFVCPSTHRTTVGLSTAVVNRFTCSPTTTTPPPLPPQKNHAEQHTTCGHAMR